MTVAEVFIRRPVATTLLTFGLVLAGAVGFLFLPVAPLPEVDFPTIQVSAAMPGASPQTMATSVAAPLERQFGRIAGVTDMTSTSFLGSTSIVLQFDLGRNIDGAARDVQAAINAARGYLPAALPNNPSYRKVNPADAPIIILALNSETVDTGRMYDLAASILQQRLAQVEGMGQVFVGGGSLPAVRVELNPAALNQYGIATEDVRNALSRTNINRPKGQLTSGPRTWEIETNDQLHDADEFRPIIVAYHDGAPVRVSDVAEVEQSVEDVRAAAVTNEKPAVLLIMFRAPGANIIDTVDGVYDLMPELRASLPAAVNLSIVLDRTPPIRASLRDVETTLVIAVILVILVVFIFLRNFRATLIPSVAVPASLIGTFGVMYLCGYSLNNLSLMALTIATGFVVDDAIVVLENVTRYLEQGMSRREAATRGAREIGFTVLSMSTSLIAVFIPVLLMGGMIGRLFREFAVTLSVAIAISLVISLTTTPMMCATVLRRGGESGGALFHASERAFDWILDRYRHSLAWALRHPRSMLTLTLLTVALNVYLFMVVPKGFFPQQDISRLSGNIQAGQDISFQAMRQKLDDVVAVLRSDPDVRIVIGFSGGGGGGGGQARNTARLFIALTPANEREATADEIVARLRPKLAKIAGAPTFLQPIQDIRIGGRGSSAQYQYTLQSERIDELEEWAPRLLERLRAVPQIVDVTSDQQNEGLQVSIDVDRDTASRLGITPEQIDNTLYDAFGQRQVAITYTSLNQYRIVMEVAPAFWQNPDTLRQLYVRAATGTLVPLSTFARYASGPTTLAVTHQAQFPAVTLSFNLSKGVALSQAVDAVEAASRQLGMPPTIRGSFQGTAQAFQAALSNQPLLILAALVTVYIVLGVLYESYIHPITILSTLPSAGVGAIIALLLCGMDLSVIAMIGILLLIGIVKKNAILMIDFALEVERREGKDPRDAIFESCLLRFRPIMMTTMAAALGALPLAVGQGIGAELRRPLGVAIVGGLLVSQALTLYTTPVVYLYLDRLRLWFARARKRVTPAFRREVVVR
jgi:multidrug efflux pump